MKNEKYWFLLIFITIIALFPRLFQLFNSSNWYYGPEQGIEYLVTKNIVIDHKYILVAHQGGIVEFLKPAGFNYLLAIPFIIFNGDPFGGRIMMFLISIITVITGFVLFNKMFGIKTAFLISLLLAISPILKDYVSSISPPFIIPFLTVFFLYFLYQAFKKKNNYIPLIFLVVGLMANFEFASSAILFFFLIVIGIICFIKKVVFPIKIYLLSLVSFLIPLLPVFIYDFNNNYKNIKGIINLLIAGTNHVANLSIPNLGISFNTHFYIFFWNFISTFSLQPILWIPIICMMVFGIYILLENKPSRSKDRLYILFLSIIPMFSFIFMFAYPSKSIQTWWFTDLNVIYCVLLGIILTHLWNKLIFKLPIFILITLLLLAFINRTYFIYKTQFSYPPSTYIKEEYPLKYVFNDAKDKPFNIIVLSLRPQENYDYLIWWYGQKYNNQPNRKPKGTYFIIIEKDVPFSIKNFPGKLIETKEINSFMVKKIVN